MKGLTLKEIKEKLNKEIYYSDLSKSNYYRKIGDCYVSKDSWYDNSGKWRKSKTLTKNKDHTKLLRKDGVKEKEISIDSRFYPKEELKKFDENLIKVVENVMGDIPYISKQIQLPFFNFGEPDSWDTREFRYECDRKSPILTFSLKTGNIDGSQFHLGCNMITNRNEINYGNLLLDQMARFIHSSKTTDVHGLLYSPKKVKRE